MRRYAAVVLLALIALSSTAAAKCYPANTRVVIFVQGLYTTYDAGGTQTSFAEDHRFDALKAAFAERGYEPKKLFDFSYAGGAFDTKGAWQPEPYPCELTDRYAADNVAVLEQTLRDYRSRHRGAHFALVGHSLGGYVAFLAGARDAARPEAERLAIDVVVTLDSPLLGASADKKVILDLIDCDKTYVAGAELAALRLDAGTADVRRYQAWAMAQAGIRLGTFGNVRDCLWNTNACTGSGFIDDGATQFLPGQAAVSTAYDIASEPLKSHDAILIDPAAVVDVVRFVGAP